MDVAACDFSCARAAAVGGHVKILKEIMSSCPSLARDKRLCEMLIREAESVNSGDGGAGAYPETPAAPAASKTTTTGRLIQAPPSSATSSTSNSNGPLQTQPLQVPSLPQHSKPRISSSFSSLSSSSSSSFSGPLPVQTAAEKKEAFQEAYTNGNVKIAYELINDPSIDPSVNDNLALCTASSQGHIDIARLLLLDFRVEVTDKAIACAAKGGHVKLVKELFASPTFKMSKDKRYCERVLRETQAVRDGLNHKVLLNGVSVTPTTLTMPKSSLSTAVPTFPPPSPQPSRSLKKEEFQSAYTRVIDIDTLPPHCTYFYF